MDRRRVAWWVAGVSLGCACEAVPMLTFPEADGGPDAGNDARDGRADSGPLSGDGTGSDIDASDLSACMGSNPPAVSFVCCGEVVCEGPQCSNECDACASKCRPTEVCCPKTNNVVCAVPGTICH